MADWQGRQFKKIQKPDNQPDGGERIRDRQETLIKDGVRRAVKDTDQNGSYNYDKYHYGYDDSSDDSDSTVYSEISDLEEDPQLVKRDPVIQSMGYKSYMKRVNEPILKREKQLHKIQTEDRRIADELEEEIGLAGGESFGYRSYMKKVDKGKRKAAAKKEKIDKLIDKMVQVDEDHQEVHERFTRLASDPHHNHAPRGPHIGDLEDGETEQHVICPREYKRLVEEISATLKQAVEMVQVVLNNEKLRYGDRIHVYVDHTLTQYLIQLTNLDTLGNPDITRYKKYAVNQLQYTINQINTLFYNISQIPSEQPKQYKVVKDILNQWGDNKYSRAKHQRPGASVPPPIPLEFYVPGQGYISPFKNRKLHPGHGTFHPHPLHHHSSFRQNKSKFDHNNRFDTQNPLYGSAQYFKEHPYTGHDHWGTLDKMGEDLNYPTEPKIKSIKNILKPKIPKGIRIKDST